MTGDAPFAPWVDCSDTSRLQFPGRRPRDRILCAKLQKPPYIYTYLIPHSHKHTPKSPTDPPIHPIQLAETSPAAALFSPAGPASTANPGMASPTRLSPHACGPSSCTVVRRTSRAKRPSKAPPVARCSTTRLSHATRSPGARHATRATLAGRATCALSRRTRASEPGEYHDDEGEEEEEDDDGDGDGASA